MLIFVFELTAKIPVLSASPSTSILPNLNSSPVKFTLPPEVTSSP